MSTIKNQGSPKVVTEVSRVLDVLVGADDFMSMSSIAGATKLQPRAVMRALRHLQEHKAVQCVEAPDGLHWFAQPKYDNRHRVIEERTKEEKPRVRKVRPPRSILVPKP